MRVHRPSLDVVSLSFPSPLSFPSNDHHVSHRKHLRSRSLFLPTFLSSLFNFYSSSCSSATRSSSSHDFVRATSSPFLATSSPPRFHRRALLSCVPSWRIRRWERDDCWRETSRWEGKVQRGFEGEVWRGGGACEEVSFELVSLCTAQAKVGDGIRGQKDV